MLLAAGTKDTDAVVVARQQNQRMLHFCCTENIVAMVLRYLPKFSSTSPFSSLEALAEESIQKKEKAEKVNFYIRHI
jgi:hypothetical protein